MLKTKCIHSQEVPVLIEGSTAPQMPDKKSPPTNARLKTLKLHWKEIQTLKHQEYTNFKVAKELTMN